MMFGKNKGGDVTASKIPLGSVGVEIGVWKGDTSRKFLVRASHLHMVDPWTPVAYKDSEEFGDYLGYLERYSKLVGSRDPAAFQRYYDKVYSEVVRSFDGLPVTIHRMTSAEFFSGFSDRVDWVYIDGSHEYQSVLDDLEGASRISNLIYGDDFGIKPGVTKAVQRFCAKRCLDYETFAGDQYKIQWS